MGPKFSARSPVHRKISSDVGVHCIRALLREASQEGLFIALIDVQALDCLLSASCYFRACPALCKFGYGSSHDTLCCRATHRQERLLLFSFDVVEDENADNNSPSLTVIDNFDIGLSANERLSVIPSDLLGFHEQLCSPPLSPPTHNLFLLIIQDVAQG